jgi:hypothetical protein
MESFKDFLFSKKDSKPKKTSKEIEVVEEIIQVVESIIEDESSNEEEHKIDNTIKSEESSQITEEFKEEIKEEPKKEIKEEILESKIEEDDSYKIYRDKSETFLCDMEITGANPENSKARIIIESKDLTYMFEGTINSKGQCKIPLKKMNFLQENERGTIKLEVIAEDMVFVPWEEDFTAVSSRKVKVRNITESEDTSSKIGIKITRIK